MEQTAKPFPMLRIAGKLPSIECKIADSLDLNSRRTLIGAEFQVAFQDKPVGSGKISGDSQTLIAHG